MLVVSWHPQQPRTVSPNKRMPVCPNCESGVGYKDDLVCRSCGFDFKRYSWIPVPWGFLRCKFQKKTLRNVSRAAFSMSTPTLACVRGYIAMGDRRFTLAGFAVLGLIVIPVTLLFTVSPIMAFLKKDALRDSYVVRGISDEPADQAVNWSTNSRGN